MYALYDADSNLYAQGKKLLSKRSENQHEELTESLYISKSGYMETFVVNETNQDVWFDNFRIQSTTPVIVQETDYDPWGLEHFGTKFQAAGVKVNKYLYNGKELIEDNGLQYYDYGARMYDASIGRWRNIDLVSELFFSVSPYVYSLNNPVLYIDRNGLWPTRKVVDNGSVGNRGFNLTPTTHPVNKSEKKRHLGQDFTVSTGNNVHSLADGKVIKAGFQLNKKSGIGWGYYLDIQHSNGYVTRYAHLSKGSFRFKEGDSVKDGEIIALSGASGGVTGPHLHLELLLNGKQIDPMLVADLQKLLNELNEEKDGAVNENNPIDLATFEITSSGPSLPKIIAARKNEMLFQGGTLNGYGNSGKYNQPGRTTDRTYSDEFLRWFYGVDKK